MELGRLKFPLEQDRGGRLVTTECAWQAAKQALIVAQDLSSGDFPGVALESPLRIETGESQDTMDSTFARLCGRLVLFFQRLGRTDISCEHRPSAKGLGFLVLESSDFKCKIPILAEYGAFILDFEKAEVCNG